MVSMCGDLHDRHWPGLRLGPSGYVAKPSPQRTQVTRARWSYFMKRFQKLTDADRAKNPLVININATGRIPDKISAGLPALAALIPLPTPCLYSHCWMILFNLAASAGVGRSEMPKETLFWAQKATQGLGVEPLWRESASPYMDPIGVNHDVPFFGLIIPVFPVDTVGIHITCQYFRIPQKNWMGFQTLHFSNQPGWNDFISGDFPNGVSL